MSNIVYELAEAADHKMIMAVAKQSRFTKDFGNQVMFSSEAAYQRGWVGIAAADGAVLGFTCVREHTRTPTTVLYFVGVDETHRSQGIGWRLIEEAMRRSRHRTMVLKVADQNPRARVLYQRHGFEVYEQSGGYDLMRRVFP